MQPQGSTQKYITVHEAPTAAQLAAHLRGEITLAGYLIDQDGKARIWKLDVDTGGVEAVRARVAALTRFGGVLPQQDATKPRIVAGL